MTMKRKAKSGLVGCRSASRYWRLIGRLCTPPPCPRWRTLVFLFAHSEVLKQQIFSGLFYLAKIGRMLSTGELCKQTGHMKL